MVENKPKKLDNFQITPDGRVICDNGQILEQKVPVSEMPKTREKPERIPFQEAA
jgi:hypothetical protein